MPATSRRVVFTAAAIAWATAAALGFSRLWTYESVPGAAARSPFRLPSESSLLRSDRLPTLVVVLHPHCPCSRATVEELAKLMTRCNGKLNATVLMVRPTGMPPEWERTDLWLSAAAIPGVTVITDDNGAEAHRLGAATSGETLLFAADGRLLFAGGITESRGHSGDNAGRALIVALVCDKTDALPNTSAPARTPVYGCALFDSPPEDGRGPCPK